MNARLGLSVFHLLTCLELYEGVLIPPLTYLKHSAACWCVLRPASVGGSIAIYTRKRDSIPAERFPGGARPVWSGSVGTRSRVLGVHSSAVEHWIADPMVTGSIPVVPSFGAVMQGSLRLVKRAWDRGGVLAQEAINERVMCKQMPFDC